MDLSALSGDCVNATCVTWFMQGTVSTSDGNTALNSAEGVPKASSEGRSLGLVFVTDNADSEPVAAVTMEDVDKLFLAEFEDGQKRDHSAVSAFFSTK